VATTSRYVLVSDSILLEYIYADQGAINTAGNEFIRNTSIDGFLRLLNSNVSPREEIIFSEDDSKTIGATVGTGNVRDRGFTVVDKDEGKFALLNIDQLLAYNDFDTNVTDTSSLGVTFSGVHSVVYDTIKLHLVQGFNFEGNEGFVFDVVVNKKPDPNDSSLNTKLKLLNLAYTKSDNFETLNPSSFFFGGRVYNSFIEIKVPSIYNLKKDYWYGLLTGDTPTEKLSSNVGWEQDGFIELNFGWIERKEKTAGQTYVWVYTIKEAAIPDRDLFDTISANIKESSVGDYFEFYAAHNGQIIDDFITNLNNAGNDFIILHDIQLFEFIGDGFTNEVEGNSGSWVKTSDFQISQVDDFEVVNLFRPILKYQGSSIAFRLDYTARLYNRNDNTQIWKSSSVTSTQVHKYGKFLRKINLGTNPTVATIYNKNVIKEISLNPVNSVSPIQNVSGYSKYVTSFIDNTFISVSNTSMYAKMEGDEVVLVESESSDTIPIYKNGLGRILINQSGNYIKFVVYDKNDNGLLSPLNLNNLGTLYLNFFPDNDEWITVTEYESANVSKSNGEVVFRITNDVASRILGLNNDSFEISTKTENAQYSHLYSGKFLNIDQWNDWRESNEIDSLNSQITSLTDSNTTLDDLNDALEAKIADLENQRDLLNAQITDLTNSLGQKITALEKQKNASNSTEIDNQISSLKDVSSKAKTVQNQQQTVQEASENDLENKVSNLSLNINESPNSHFDPSPQFSGGDNTNLNEPV
jgi:hypothetical protein